jgi:nitroreductase
MENKILEVIKSRRTTRTYQDKKISKEELETILEAGQWAPSGHNIQSWHFTVLENKELQEELNTKSKESALNVPVEDIRKMAGNPNFHIFYNAPTVVLVSYDEKALTPIQDISAATQNMLLTAESMGIGSCWNGFVSFLFQNEQNAEKYRKKLQIPTGYKLSHAIVLGYPKQKVLNSPKRKENFYNVIK